MDNSGLGSGFLSGFSGGFLGMNRLPQNQYDDIGARTRPELDSDKPVVVMEDKSSTPRGFTMTFGNERGAGHGHVQGGNGNMSEEDEPNFMEDENGENADDSKGKKESPWHRMKWTDSIIRLLIQVVAYVGDDGSLDGAEGLRRKASCIHKKGKWKTVSRIMISKGCHVSPQQCEDKFNDLNKRYKKLNDILGKGTSCAVVENPALMDSMPQLTDKDKETVKKILNSKHLFYREMCAYHNGQKIPDCGDAELQIHPSSLAAQYCKDNNGSQGEETDNIDDSEDDRSESDEDNNAGMNPEKMRDFIGKKKMNEDEGNILLHSGGQDNFQAEIDEFLQNPTKSLRERKEWIKKRMLNLEEEGIGIQAEALELEKRRFKWQRFCSKKDRELEMARLENERSMLENEQMVLLLKHREFEIEFKSEPSFMPSSFNLDRHHRRDQMDSGEV